ncbi:MAG: hypothetical protein QGF59_11860, partial [Pirellulaceae bacterium]|nr:hypothetical protein [Pirellulaceae bacterium]
MRRILYVFLSLSFMAASGNAQAETPKTKADGILAQAGFTGGVIVYLNARDGALASALGRSPQARVHGLSSNRRDIETARRVIQEKGDYGKTSVEYFASSELPYVDNLVNLVYCE